MYIRTKDGVYEVESDYLNNKGVRVGYNVVGQEEVVLIENNNIIQSENLEELCDEFVVVNNTCFNTPQLLGTVIDKDYYKHEEVYGAIWTSKGLIYVAKMNSKGVLELI